MASVGARRRAVLLHLGLDMLRKAGRQGGVWGDLIGATWGNTSGKDSLEALRLQQLAQLDSLLMQRF